MDDPFMTSHDDIHSGRRRCSSPKTTICTIDLARRQAPEAVRVDVKSLTALFNHFRDDGTAYDGRQPPQGRHAGFADVTTPNPNTRYSRVQQQLKRLHKQREQK